MFRKMFKILETILEVLIYLSENSLTFSWRRPLSYRNQSIDLQSKSMDWFLYNSGPRHERVKKNTRFGKINNDLNK